MTKIFERRSFPPLMIILTAAFVYWPGFYAPVILDDVAVLDAISEGSLGDYFLAFLTLKARSFAALSFRINYDLNYGWLPAYRIVNLSIHCANGILVFKILGKLLGLSSPEKDRIALMWPALFGAMIFALHPIQVQAVAYIAQRFVLLASFFYLACVWMFIDLRARRAFSARWTAQYLAILFSVLLAVMSKEIAVTIPAALFLVEWIFPQGPGLARRKFLIPIAFIALIPVFTRLIGGGQVAPWIFTRSGFSDNAGVSYSVYTATEMNVLLEYIRLIAWPTGLHFIHDVRAAVFSDARIILSSLVHLSIISSAVLFRKRAPLAALGVLFFYLSHIVESFTVPLIFSMFEYRCYLSMAGVSMIACSAARFVLANFGMKQRTAFFALTSIALVALSLLSAWQNVLYSYPVALWRRSVAFSPIQPLSHAWLGKSYMDLGFCAEALPEFEIARDRGLPGMPAKIREVLDCLGTSRLGDKQAVDKPQ